MSQEHLEMREFSFGKSTPPDDEADGDSGSSPSLNVFYNRTDTCNIKPGVDISQVKQENINEDQVKQEF